MRDPRRLENHGERIASLEADTRYFKDDMREVKENIKTVVAQNQQILATINKSKGAVAMADKIGMAFIGAVGGIVTFFASILFHK